MATSETTPTTNERGLQRSREGIVVSDKMEKTIVVSVTRQVKHATYGKFVKKTRRYFAHDEKNECGVGDRVKIVETRPISKNKHWRVEKVLVKAA
jgi:small subunit ribosomal protein S17